MRKASPGGLFELVELAVACRHRRGLGRRLYDALLAGVGRQCLLSTADDRADPAVRLCLSSGWQKLGILRPGVQVRDGPGHARRRRSAGRDPGRAFFADRPGGNPCDGSRWNALVDVRFHRGHGWLVQYQHSRIHPLASPADGELDLKCFKFPILAVWTRRLQRRRPNSGWR